MAKYPTRAHSVVISLGADTQDAMLQALKEIISDIKSGSTKCASGSPSVGYMFEYITDPNMTHDAYFTALDEILNNG